MFEAETFASRCTRRVLPLPVSCLVSLLVWACRVVLYCLSGRAAAPHWLFFPSWPRLLTQNTFAISFIPSPDGARRSFMRGLPKARTITGRTSLPPTRPVLPSMALPPSPCPLSPFPSSSSPSYCAHCPICPAKELMNRVAFSPRKSLGKACHNPKSLHSKSPFTLWSLDKAVYSDSGKGQFAGSFSPVLWYTRAGNVGEDRWWPELAWPSELALQHASASGRLPPDVTREAVTTWESLGPLMTQFL